MDKISCIIILRALFIYSVLEKGWGVKKSKSDKNSYTLYKSVKKEY
jgi:hypothetical protein